MTICNQNSIFTINLRCKDTEFLSIYQIFLSFFCNNGVFLYKKSLIDYLR